MPIHPTDCFNLIHRNGLFEVLELGYIVFQLLKALMHNFYYRTVYGVAVV